MNILDVALAGRIAASGGGGGGTGTVTSVSVQGGSGSHLTASGNPIETSGTITIDIDDGYSIPSDNEQTAWDGKAADLKAEIDSSTYVLTLQLKDSAGNLIGSEKKIDLPLETMVVDGEYDSQTQKIKLELKNGNYVEFSVADLVSGLQTELSASNKLDPDYIDYDASHRAVSDTEKDTWNSKQNAISDLATIRSGAAAGATAVQPSTMEDALDDKQDTIDSSHKLSSALVSFSTAQNAALASGIDSAKVSQISTINSTAYNAVSSASSYVKDIEGGYIQIGKLVIVNIRCTVNTEITSSTTFITGLPKSIVQYNQGYGAASVSNNIQKTINVLGNGSIGVGNDTIAVGTVMVLSASYMAK